MNKKLSDRLKASIEGMGLSRIQFGFPEMVLKEVKNAEALFKDFSEIKPSSQDAYTAALRLLRGEELDDWAINIVAAAISIPIREQNGLTVLESKYCDALFNKYENEARTGDLWRLTWYSLLNSYLSYNLIRATTNAGATGFIKLRKLLYRTWPLIEKQSNERACPEWVRILRQESQLLSDNPVEKYDRDFLAGNTDQIKTLAESLGIPANSWFWEELVLGAVRRAIKGRDDQFRSQLLLLIELVKFAPVYRDTAITEILNRYYQCSSKTVHPELRDFVISPSVWRNPKLKVAGIATAWNQVPEAVWRMVMGWVNERNLKDFFDILAARSHADHGRLRFWSQYINQISWTRLVFGSETIWQKTHNEGIRTLLESEEGAFAVLRGATDRELDAFLMQIEGYIIVEFSKTGNGAYIYRASDLPFNLHTKTYEGSTSDLKSGYYTNGRAVAKIIHTPGWEDRTHIELNRLGIYPDRVTKQQKSVKNNLSAQQVTALKKINALTQNIAQANALQNSTLPTASLTHRGKQPTSGLSIEKVHNLVSKYKGVKVTENGSGITRRIWVTNPDGWLTLEHELKNMGFRWAASRQSWYWTED